ncbi:MAG: flagellar export chaperone FliS [Allosphingosinicella sp.]|uniref:flagellar export chaperone FliS n=1 Tax=Allosphingosinicella sp. TaxID=2823234 RepID=UPI003961FD25
MYQPRGQFGFARARYHTVDLSSRIEGATPHQLVAILFDEGMKALDAMAAAIGRGDYVQRGERQSRALRIISGLEESLDFDRGGEVARGLAAIYAEARRLALAAGRDNDAGKATQAREMLAEIAAAWTQIGRPAAA